MSASNNGLAIPPDLRGRSPVLLLVEDDPDIADLISMFLDYDGLAVRTERTGIHAAIAIERHASSIYGIITDVNLGKGGPSGWDLARRARELKPQMPVIYIAGACAAQWPAQGVPNSILLPKPFALARLIGAMSTLFDGVLRFPRAANA